jgi:hypothetical protein
MHTCWPYRDGSGVGGIDAVIPVCSSELSSDGARGRALTQEFQMNIFGLLMSYGINLGVTLGLGKDDQWACRIPIVIMQIFPILLMSFISQLPETLVLEQRTEGRSQESHGTGSQQKRSQVQVRGIAKSPG